MMQLSGIILAKKYTPTIYKMSSVTQPQLTDSQKTEITDYINAYRAKHRAPPLQWDNTIATFSQQWSYHLVSNNLFQHSVGSGYGENLAYFKGYGIDPMTLLKKAVDSWYNEVTLYNFNNPGFSQGTGHFTCLVWKSSTNYGMGISIDTATKTVDVTFNTSPPGNYSGQYQLNVLPARTTPAPVPVPLPTPLPVPLPIPNPLPLPVPVQNKAIILNALQTILNALRTNQSRNTLIILVYDLIKLVTALSI